MANSLKQQSLDYHMLPIPGKLSVVARKPLANQHDLSLAYSPGVAFACEAIVEDPANAALMTGRQNLVGVITNGTAVLGLGAIGGLASKPVMEGKAVLFKKFAGVDVFDIEIEERDPHKLVEIIKSLEPTFGAINLEDIKAPECFIVESELRKQMKIPVFHDDQHGTAITVNAAIFNALRVVDKPIEKVKVVSTGGGAAGVACLNLLVSLGLPIEQIHLIDRVGLVYKGRTEEMDDLKAKFAQDTDARSLDDVIDGADIFLGLSAPKLLTGDMVKRMADKPIIMALANPEPEITPEEAKAANPDAIIATGRSDYPNQVNNVLCFPFIFRGALDVGATTINEEMKIACVKAIADLAMAESSEIVAAAYAGEELKFGPEYLIPKPFDPRLIIEVAPAIAKAAMDSGVATKEIEDFDAYRDTLHEFVFKSGQLMRPIFYRASQDPKRIVYAEGESKRVLRAVQSLVDQKMVKPILIGRPDVVQMRVDGLGLRLKQGVDYEICDPQDDPRYGDYWRQYHSLMERKGVSPDAARTIIRTNTTAIASIMLKRGEADAMICGTYGQYDWHLRYVMDIIDKQEGVANVSALSVLLLSKGTYFFCDTHVTPDPTAEQLAEMTILAGDEIRRFGITPKVGLLSHSNFGSHHSERAVKMSEAVKIIRKLAPELEVEGEMQGDVALNEEIRDRVFPNSQLEGRANLLIMPTLGAANISFNLVKSLGEGLSVGPLLIGTAQPAHVVTPAISARGIVNISALAVVDAQSSENEQRELL
ncbi:MAG: NADP-dependent malic enzyme [Rhodospirillaceae bacterium]|jgi:malate dehydrogenase (oxaloacetate-decarboxylating)(NADP+)|nr:NADP-dependent malic enzyme [Rhodospirillales bacterium]MBT3905714.1 NADP-dependent malic enzyme [Rhodospirillaceae bacterium]MBT5034920.1 NADP-dependent malic enzyme [Rhodospirillaceae bacterium]MBT6221689.1 NADP-dependent malic enzyme [Rhodospirillaceae bacterium]MBT7769902.1 NADP-dependent malic enzyme [Rhodospirillales bacterium]